MKSLLIAAFLLSFTPALKADRDEWDDWNHNGWQFHFGHRHHHQRQGYWVEGHWNRYGEWEPGHWSYGEPYDF